LPFEQEHEHEQEHERGEAYFATSFGEIRT
jgi:hypothetical protein